MSYPAIAIADYFLSLAWEENKGLSPMQIQKPVYLLMDGTWLCSMTNLFMTE